MRPMPRSSTAVPARRLAVAAVLASALGGCATLDNGVLDDVSVITDPPGATITSSTGTLCTSPCRVSGPRRDSFTVTAAKPGFVTASATAEAKANAAAVERESRLEATPDALGRMIDLQDGTLYTHEPKVLVIKLVKAP